jgi:hypothetical protein
MALSQPERDIRPAHYERQRNAGGQEASHAARHDETVDLVIGIGEEDGQIPGDTEIDPEILDIFALKPPTFA